MSLKRRLAALEALAAPPPGQEFIQYRTDPIRYGREVLHIRHVTPDQEAVLRYVADHPHCRLLVPSGNETGKSFVAAWIAAWHYDCWQRGFTMITAPSAAQVHDIIFRELRMMRRGHPDFAPKADLATSGPEHVLKGFTAKEGTSFQGRHDASMMLIFDEAEGVHKQFWEAGESFAHRWICFYNPTKGDSQAAVEERSGRWKIIRMSALNHPNVKAGEQGRPPIIPAAVTLPKVVARLEKWATIVREGDPPDDTDIVVAGVRYRLGPVAQARILGVRPTKPVNACYSEDMIQATDTQVKLETHWPIQIGVDVARFGDDFTVFHVRKGRCSINHEAYNGWNTVQIATRARQLCDDLCRAYGDDRYEIPVVIDDTGVGGGVVDQAHGYRFIGINASQKASEPEEYPNIRSEMAFDFEGMLREKLVDLSRIPEQQKHDICEQLRAMSYVLDGRGRRVVAPKKDIKERLNRSPDDADAVLLSYFQFPDTVEIHKK